MDIGTNPQDGAGLLAGLTQTLAKRGADCPKTVCIYRMMNRNETYLNAVLADHRDSLSVSLA